ncbi:MAG: polysaccharide-degrading enzyme, partial [Verrucomicrobia bacterium]|nr:polysaccharide-degrading enzyme [Verrucomicrobiota bacterium]
MLCWLAVAARAANFDVGPGQPLTALRNVPWATLQPGDFVNIHVQPGGYHEKIQVSASGTANAHIVIRGIPDPVTGALPIIDGK